MVGFRPKNVKMPTGKVKKCGFKVCGSFVSTKLALISSQKHYFFQMEDRELIESKSTLNGKVKKCLIKISISFVYFWQSQSQFQFLNRLDYNFNINTNILETILAISISIPISWKPNMQSQ